MLTRLRYHIRFEEFLNDRAFLITAAGTLVLFLLATNQVAEIENFLNRALILHKGQIAADLTIDSLRDSEKSLLGLMQEASGYDTERYRKFL